MKLMEGPELGEGWIPAVSRVCIFSHAPGEAGKQRLAVRLLSLHHSFAASPLGCDLALRPHL